MLIPVFAAVGSVYMEMNTVSAYTLQWVQSGGYWYFYNAQGNLVYGWQNVWGKYYYFRQWADYPSPGPAGTIVTGWQLVNSEWYYFEPTTNPNNGNGGHVVNGFKYVSNGWYYFQEAAYAPNNHGGKRLTGWLQIGSPWYYMNSSGIMQTGWQTLSSRKYYFMLAQYAGDGRGGQMVTGKQTIGNNKHAFVSSGTRPDTSPYRGMLTSNYLSEQDKCLLPMEGHGWTSFSMSFLLEEKYTISGNNTNLTYRYQYFDAISSRAHWDTPYGCTVTPIAHTNSSGTVLQTFSMQTPSSQIIPQNYFFFVQKENFTSVSYNINNTNKSRFSVSISGSGCLWPYSKVWTLNLAVPS